MTASHLRHVCGGETPCPETLHAQTSDDDSPGSRKGQQEHLPGSAPAPPSSEHVAPWGDGRLPGGGAFGGSVRALRGRGTGPGCGPGGRQGRGGRPPGAWLLGADRLELGRAWAGPSVRAPGGRGRCQGAEREGTRPHTGRCWDGRADLAEAQGRASVRVPVRAGAKRRALRQAR